MAEPKNPEDAEFFMAAYSAMATERAFETGPIPWSKVMLYAEFKGLAPDVTNLLWDVVMRMDQAEQRWIAKKVRSASAGGEAGGEGGD